MSIKYINDRSRAFFEEDNYVFRVIPLDRFIELQEGKMVFVSPAKWSDPYEKAFMEADYHFEGGVFKHPLGKNGGGHHVYAQCWSGNKQNEAMWKVFAPNSDGVLLKIHVKKLLQILTQISKRRNYVFYLGKVDYINEEEMYEMKSDYEVWEDIKLKRISNKTLALLYKKREAFKFENEIRIFALKKTGVNQSPLASFNVNEILNYFTYVKFDPRMGEKLFSFTKQVLESNYPNLNIHKSRLYKKPIKKLVYGQNRPAVIDDETFIE